VRDQLARLGGLPDFPVRVTALPGGPLGWRSRVRYAVGPSGVPGLRAHRSHDIVPIDRCLIAHPEIQAQDVLASTWPGVSSVEVIASSGGDVTVLADGEPVAGPALVRERALGREWTLDANAFWQVHPDAPDTLASTVLDLLNPASGDQTWDLYGGVGLFAAALAGAGARVTLVESDPRAVTAARDNLADLPAVQVVRGRVERLIGRLPVPDLVVLDPPRAGAGAAVVRAIVAAAPRAIAYVACDPAAFARDVRTFRELGWELAELHGFDMFPMTHHVELVGLLLSESGVARLLNP
jgi:tRNA/tmRNA/rRNA uracil-C5-methylase (TrmA/RlmC/RlmD family)